MTIYPLAGISVLAISFASEIGAQTNKVAFQISVEKRVYGERVTQPFHGVGTFDLLQGAAPLQGATCPNRSNAAGQLTCTVPCKASDALPQLVRVRPPSDQDSLGGWVAPTMQEIEVKQCVAKPAKVTMLYEDARYALNEFLSKQYFAKGIGQGGAGGGGAARKLWVTEIAEGSPVATNVSATANTADGREELFQLHKLATEAARAPELQNSNLSSEDRKLSEALARWQILSKSSLLKSQISQALPGQAQGGLKLTPTTDLVKYRLNLTEADVVLKGASRSSAQQRLADDVSTLKSLPATGPGAAAANKVIEAWR